MADVFKMPKLGETVTTGTVTRWLRAVGDTIGFDDPLLEVATDKVDSEIPSPYSGVLLEIMVPEGETVAVGAELARIGEPASLISSDAPTGNGRPKLSPIVRKLAARHGIDLGTIQGSGATGRITREDIEAAIARFGAPPQEPRAPQAPSVSQASQTSFVPSVSSVTPAQPGPRDEV